MSDHTNHKPGEHVMNAGFLPHPTGWAERVAAEEAVRAAAAARAQAILQVGGRITVSAERTQLRTVLLETMHDGSGACVDIRNAGEIWG